MTEERGPAISFRRLGDTLESAQERRSWSPRLPDETLPAVPGCIAEARLPTAMGSNSLSGIKWSANWEDSDLSELLTGSYPTHAIHGLVVWQADGPVHGCMREYELLDCSLATVGAPGALRFKRFIRRFAVDVLEVDEALFAALEAGVLNRDGCTRDRQLASQAIVELTSQFLDLVASQSAQPFPISILSQVMAIASKLSRGRVAPMDDDGGVATLLLRRFFDSADEGFVGSGQLSTRDPRTGHPSPVLRFAPGRSIRELRFGMAQDVLGGESLRLEYPAVHKKVGSLLATLPDRGVDSFTVCDFVVVDGDLLIVDHDYCATSGRAKLGAIAHAIRLGRDADSEIAALAPSDLGQVGNSQFEVSALRHARELAHGLGASSGAVAGRLCTTIEQLTHYRRLGDPTVYVGVAPGPRDVAAALSADGIAFASGGMTSHIAVIARGAGIGCVMGLAGLQPIEGRDLVNFADHSLRVGDWVSLDGDAGKLFEGRLPVSRLPTADSADLETVLKYCDSRATIQVLSNADNAGEALSGQAHGARGVGLCRLEHLLARPNSISSLQACLILALLTTEMVEARVKAERDVRLWRGPEAEMVLREVESRLAAQLRYNQYISSLEVLEELMMDGLSALFASVGHGSPVIVRLLDAPLHEFLPSVPPSITDELKLSDVDLALVASARGDTSMLGLRGARLSLRSPELTRAQMSAILRAASLHGRDEVDVLIPMVSDAMEVKWLRGLMSLEADRLRDEQMGRRVQFRLGAMVETPRAAIVAHELSTVADFLSFGTNDLTQFTWAWSRDIEESVLFGGLPYEELLASPFRAFDRDGVGKLMKHALDSVRNTSRNPMVGVCGELAGQPNAIAMLAELGINYVSCSAPTVPAARLAAAQAALSTNCRHDSR